MGIVLPTKEAHFVPKSKCYGELLKHHNCREKLKGIKLNFKVAIQSNRNIPGVYAGGVVHRVHLHPPPPLIWEKSSAQKCPKEERKFRPDMSAKKNLNVPLRYDKIKTKKVEKKKKSDKIKEKAVCRK